MNQSKSESELEKMTYIDSQESRVMLVNAYKAIQLTEMWGYMKKTQEHYMFNKDNELNIISKKMTELEDVGHSGFSFGWTMREMQFIANYGLEEHKKLWESNSSSNSNN